MKKRCSSSTCETLLYLQTLNWMESACVNEWPFIVKTRENKMSDSSLIQINNTEKTSIVNKTVAIGPVTINTHGFDVCAPLRVSAGQCVCWEERSRICAAQRSESGTPAGRGRSPAGRRAPGGRTGAAAGAPGTPAAARGGPACGRRTRAEGCWVWQAWTWPGSARPQLKTRTPRD